MIGKSPDCHPYLPENPNYTTVANVSSSNRFALRLSQNPNGIPSQSPGLRAPRYPGK